MRFIAQHLTGKPEHSGGHSFRVTWMCQFARAAGARDLFEFQGWLIPRTYTRSLLHQQFGWSPTSMQPFSYARRFTECRFDTTLYAAQIWYVLYGAVWASSDIASVMKKKFDINVDTAVERFERILQIADVSNDPESVSAIQAGTLHDQRARKTQVSDAYGDGPPPTISAARAKTIVDRCKTIAEMYVPPFSQQRARLAEQRVENLIHFVEKEWDNSGRTTEFIRATMAKEATRTEGGEVSHYLLARGARLGMVPIVVRDYPFPLYVGNPAFNHDLLHHFPNTIGGKKGERRPQANAAPLPSRPPEKRKPGRPKRAVPGQPDLPEAMVTQLVRYNEVPLEQLPPTLRTRVDDIRDTWANFDWSKPPVSHTLDGKPRTKQAWGQILRRAAEAEAQGFYLLSTPNESVLASSKSHFIDDAGNIQKRLAPLAPKCSVEEWKPKARKSDLLANFRATSLKVAKAITKSERKQDARRNGKRTRKQAGISLDSEAETDLFKSDAE
jgi:hypothetical protein